MDPLVMLAAQHAGDRAEYSVMLTERDVVTNALFAFLPACVSQFDNRHQALCSAVTAMDKVSSVEV